MKWLSQKGMHTTLLLTKYRQEVIPYKSCDGGPWHNERKLK